MRGDESKDGVVGGSEVKHLAYRYRIYPNKDQEELIQKTFGCVRFVYNHYLSERITEYNENGRCPSLFQQNKSLTLLKNQHPWLKEPDKNALQYALRDLDAAYKNFYRGIKTGQRIGFPKFKSKKTGRNSYTAANNNGNGIRIEGNKIHLPKIGFIRAKVSRKIRENSRIIRATISQEPSGKYHVSIVTETEVEDAVRTLNKLNSIGLDYSSPHFYVDSENNVADMPHFYRESEKRLIVEQRKLSRMVRGSNNYEKQRIRLARAYEKVRNSRNDWQHKESTRLADSYDYICVEGINYKDMAKGLNLSKATNDNSFGRFRSMIAYKMAERGKKLITIDKWFPSSKMCRFCGAINSELTLKDREWDCACGAHLIRDHNAAINIREEGLRNAC